MAIGIDPDYTVFFGCSVRSDFGVGWNRFLAGNIDAVSGVVKGPMVEEAADVVAFDAANAEVGAEVGAKGIEGADLIVGASVEEDALVAEVDRFGFFLGDFLAEAGEVPAFGDDGGVVEYFGWGLECCVHEGWMVGCWGCGCWAGAQPTGLNVCHDRCWVCKYRSIDCCPMIAIS